MSSTVVEHIRESFQQAHWWLTGTMEGVTAEVAHYQPAGVAMPIGAEYVHVAVSEDYFVSLLQGRAPLMMSHPTGANSPPPSDQPWIGWSRTVRVDLDQARAYHQTVYAQTDAFLQSLTDAELEQSFDASAVGLGVMTWGSLLSTLRLNVLCHAGEISAIKGLQGLKGYPM